MFETKNENEDKMARIRKGRNLTTGVYVYVSEASDGLNAIVKTGDREHNFN